jgi:hypothetical protein
MWAGGSLEGRRPVVDEIAVVLATLEPPPKRLGITHWSSWLLGAELGISHVWVGQIWCRPRPAALAVRELLDLGLTAGQIARRTHTPVKRVKATTSVARSELAAAVLNRYDIPLDQVAVIAEFDDGTEKGVEAIKATSLRQCPGWEKDTMAWVALTGPMPRRSVRPTP